jgi:hypothetical protein
MEKQLEAAKGTAEVAEKLRIRCPSCAKLYEVESGDIHSSSPQFQCVSCQCRFTFSFPPLDPQNISCISIDAESHSQIDEVMKSQRSCPKCGALSPREAEECYSCHVIFSRLQGLPEDPTLRAQPSLVRKWKMVAEDFDDEDKHEDFIRGCQDLEALPFAMTKYQEMSQALGGDPVCERRQKQIQAMIEHKLRAPKAAAVPVKKTPETPAELWSARWQKIKKYLIYIPYGLSLFLILWGAFSLGHRNLVGLGVAIACLATGLTLTLRGRQWH